VQKPTIAYIEYSDFIGGSQVYLLHLLTKIKNLVRPIVICQPNSAIYNYFKGTDVGVNALPLGFIRRSYNPILMLKFVKGQLTTIFRLRQIFRRKNVSLIHANGTFSLLSSLLAAKINGTPVVWTFHTGYLPQRAGGFIRLLTKSVDKTICVSDFLKKNLTNSKGKQKFVTIHNGVDLKEFEIINHTNLRGKLQIEANDLVVGTVSRLSEMKGIRYLLEAFPLIVQNCKHVKFLIVGDGPQKDKFENMALDYGGDGIIHFVGFQKDPLKWISIMDIFVLPSLSEALPYSILEAMGFGKPIVATDVGGVKEIVREGINGYLVPLQSSQELAKAILKLLQNKTKRKLMGKASRRIVEKEFTEEKMIEKTMAVYEDALSGREIK